MGKTRRLKTIRKFSIPHNVTHMSRDARPFPRLVDFIGSPADFRFATPPTAAGAANELQQVRSSDEEHKVCKGS
jgi:hypothetical protein